MAGINLKSIGSTLDSIGKATTKPLLNSAENIIMAPFDTIKSIGNNMTSNPMFYIMVGGVLLIIINKK